MKPTKVHVAIRIAILTVSDTRTLAEDTSGDYLVERIKAADHIVCDRKIVTDDIGKIRAIIEPWIKDNSIDVIITTGGTGLTGRDITPEAIRPLFDKEIEGFSSIFHIVSCESVGVATLQSRATAGIANGTIIVVVPGSSGGVKDAWDKVIVHELDINFRP